MCWIWEALGVLTPALYISSRIISCSGVGHHLEDEEEEEFEEEKLAAGDISDQYFRRYILFWIIWSIEIVEGGYK